MQLMICSSRDSTSSTIRPVYFGQTHVVLLGKEVAVNEQAKEKES